VTVAEARKTLRPPLKFGDEKQIAAHRFLEAVELAKEAIERNDVDALRQFSYDVWTAARQELKCPSFF